MSEPLSEGPSVSVMPLVAVAGVYGKVALAGVYIAGDARWETESLGPSSVAYCLEGKVADIGESAFGLKPRLSAGRSPSNPNPTGSGALSSGGGVGVLGGTGNGIFEAIMRRRMSDSKEGIAIRDSSQSDHR